MIYYNMDDLITGRIDPSCGIQIGDYVQRLGYSSGIYRVTDLKPTVFDCDAWHKQGSPKCIHYTYEPNDSYVTLRPNTDWRPYFCLLHLDRIATAKFKPLKVKKKPQYNYFKTHEVRKIDKAMFQSELQSEIDELKKRYDAIINLLP